MSRDAWDGDYSRPLSLNRWNYVEGNPVNRVDPTGLTPFRKGYLEGVSATRSGLGNATIFGEEIVYDYATMTRARFKYEGDIGGIYASFFDATIYLGGITGFKYEERDNFLSGGSDLSSNSAYPELPRSQKIIEDYGGSTDGWYIGGSPIPVSAGVGYFHSSNGYIKGVFDYVSVGVSPIKFEAVTFHTWYDVDSGALPGYNGSGIEYYYDVKTGNVDEGRLISDILSGDHSPIRGGAFFSLTSYVGGTRNSQISIALIGAREFEKYYYRPMWAQCRDGQPDPQPLQPIPDPFSNPIPFP